MKRNRITLVTVLLLAAALALAGCSSGEEGSSRSGEARTDTSEEMTADEQAQASSSEFTDGDTSEEDDGGELDPDVPDVSDDGEAEESEDTDDNTGVFTCVLPDDLDIPGGYRRTGEIVYTNGDSYDLHDIYYDANGNQVLEFGFASDGEPGYSDYREYDDEGNLISEVLWNRTDYAAGLMTTYEYGPYGISEVHVECAENGDQLYYLVYDYDGQGRVTFIHHFVLPADHEVRGYEYVYNDDGSFTRYYWSDVSGTYERSEIQWQLYDTHGNLIEDYACPIDTVDRTVYTYDDSSNLIREEDLRGDSRRYMGGADYEYDDQGRLVTRTRYHESGSVNFVENYTYEPI